MKIVGKKKMKGKSTLGLLVLVTILLTSISLAMVAAQYTTQATTPVTIGSNGSFTAQDSTVGASYVITGAVGATGSVTTDVYAGNPYSSAAIPSGVSLAHFVVITFNMNADDFSSATVTLNYTAADVQNLKAPFSVYKYDTNSNSYVVLPSTVDTSAMTVTVTLTSINDPLLAIGGSSTVTSGGFSALTWGIIIVAVVIIVLVAVFVVTLFRKNQ